MSYPIGARDADQPRTEEGFQAWLERVEKVLDHLAGCSIHDLPDYCYRDAYDDGVRPVAAARRAIRAAGGDFC